MEEWARWQPELYCQQAPDWSLQKRNEVLAWLLQQSLTTPEICEALISAGANPNYVDEHGRTLLILACMWNRTDLARVLLVHGADPNVQAVGRCALRTAVTHEAPIEMIRLLMRHGACVDCVTHRGDGALDIALAMNRLAHAHALLDYGVRTEKPSLRAFQKILLERRHRCRSAARTLYGILRWRLPLIYSWGGYPLQREIARRAAVLVWATRAHVAPWSQGHARPPIADPAPK